MGSQGEVNQREGQKERWRRGHRENGVTGERGQREGWRRGHRKGGIPGREREGPLEEGDSRRQR